MIKKIKKTILIILKGIIYLIPIILLAWLITKDLVVSGEIYATYDFKNLSPFISVLRPQDRVSEPLVDQQGYYYQIIKKEPVYFDVRLPRRFDKAIVTVKYKNLDQPITQLGAMTDFEKWLFDLKPIENKIIEKLFLDKLRWTSISEDDLVLFQKKSEFKNISDFLTNLPKPEKIATYNYKIDRKFIISNYQPQSKEIDIIKSLRGTHRFYTYVKNESLDVAIWYQDVNRHLGDDYLDIDIYYEDELIYSQFLKDDGNSSDNRQLSELKEININLPNLPEGAYRIELICNDDIFFRRIKTPQDYLVFINQVYLADNVSYADEFLTERQKPTWLYTNGTKITAYTSHLEGLQNLGVGNQLLEIKETHKNYSLITSFGNKLILSPRNDILIKTKGLIGLSEKDFFNPEFVSLADGEDFNQEQIDYIIAKYPRPFWQGNWKVNQLVFEVDKYYTGDDQLHFVLSLPYLEEEQEGIEVSEIKVLLKKEPLTWKDFIEKLRSRLFKILSTKS